MSSLVAKHFLRAYPMAQKLQEEKRIEEATRHSRAQLLAMQDQLEMLPLQQACTSSSTARLAIGVLTLPALVRTPDLPYSPLDS